MPHHELHERKKTKNYVLLALLVFLMALLFGLAFIKVPA
jgi:cytochrome c oxidase assembly protein Cox11